MVEPRLGRAPPRRSTRPAASWNRELDDNDPPFPETA